MPYGISNSGMDDRIKRVNKLIHRIQNGDESAVDSLYVEFGRLFLNMAKKYLFDVGYAEDLLSETFLEILRNRARSFNREFNGLNWIFTIIRHKAFRYNKKYGAVSFESVEYAKAVEKYFSNADPLVADMDLYAALRGLTDGENELLYYKYWEGLTVREIAAKLDMPKSTVQHEIKRVLNKLRKKLE